MNAEAIRIPDPLIRSPRPRQGELRVSIRAWNGHREDAVFVDSGVSQDPAQERVLVPSREPGSVRRARDRGQAVGEVVCVADRWWWRGSRCGDGARDERVDSRGHGVVWDVPATRVRSAFEGENVMASCLNGQARRPPSAAVRRRPGL